MSEQGPLGAFLSTRRSQLQPKDVDLRTYGDRRRVPGLRREELAQLAGVGVSYYIRLEQGQATNASAEVLDALARALLLDDAERRHLYALAATPRRASPRRPPAERMTHESEQLLAVLGDAPALILGRRTDVLAWNRTGHALFAGHLDAQAPSTTAARPNMARLVFLDVHTRDLYVDWTAKARAVVGNLRLLVGAHPDDPLLASLVGELTILSHEFATLWAGHQIRDCDVAVYAMRHPLVGGLTITQQTLPVPLAPGQRLVVATAAPGTRDADSLTLLAQMTAGPVRSRTFAHPQRYPFSQDAQQSTGEARKDGRGRRR